MKITEIAHRHKSIELEKIEIKTGGKLNLKLFAYPIKTTVYRNRLAFVVFYEYQTTDGVYKNIDETSKTQPRFWINKNENIKDVTKSGELKLLVTNPAYQKLRLKIVQEAIFNSANDYSKKQSKNNIDWFNEHRDEFSKRQIGANDFVRDDKRIEIASQERPQKIVTFIPEKIEETPFIEIPKTEEVVEVVQPENVTSKNTAPSKDKRLTVKALFNQKRKSSGLAKFIKKHAA